MQRRNKGALRRCFCACGLSLLLCAACSGCALLDTLARWVESGVSGEPYVSREEQIYIETAESFLDAVARENRAAVRALFSENVRETDEDFDAQLDLLFEADLDASAFWDRDDIQLQGSYRHDDGRHAAVVQDTFPIRDRGRYYWCTLELTYTDDFDPGEVGITALAFYSAEYYCALLYEAADAEWPAGSGLDVRTAYPADGDIRAAGGSPYRFENDTPPLEEDAVRDFLGQTDSFSEFCAHFGMPNAAQVYYIYALQSDADEAPLYLQLTVVEETDTIYTAAVVDDLGWLRLVWKRADEGN